MPTKMGKKKETGGTNREEAGVSNDEKPSRDDLKAALREKMASARAGRTTGGGGNNKGTQASKKKPSDGTLRRLANDSDSDDSDSDPEVIEEAPKQRKGAPKKSTSATSGAATETDDSEIDEATKRIMGTIETEPASRKMQFIQFVAIMSVFIFLFLLKAGEEAFQSGGNHTLANDERDLYEVLDAQRSDSSAEIKKKYRKLAIRWHPDKNPGCEECDLKFKEISRAYETLSEPSKRKSYDRSNSIGTETLTSAATDLSGKSYWKEVLASDDVWVIQTYSENDNDCQSFHQHWEEVVTTKLAKTVKFGRVNADEHPEALTLLPVRARYHPTIFIYAPSLPNEMPAVYPMGRHQSPAKFEKWIRKNYPESGVWMIKSREDLQIYKNFGHKMRLLMISPSAEPNTAVKKNAICWRNVFSLGFISHAKIMGDSKMRKAFKTYKLENSKAYFLVYKQEDNTLLEKVEFPKAAIPEALLERALYTLQARFASPSLSSLNVGRLCNSNPQYRVYCLVRVVDDSTMKSEEEMLLEEDEVHETLSETRKKFLSALAEGGAKNAAFADDIFARAAAEEQKKKDAKKKNKENEMKAKTKKKKIASEIASEDDEEDDDDNHLEEDDDVEYIQYAKLDLRKSSLFEWTDLNHLPPPKKVISNWWKNQAEEAPFILIDADTKRFFPVKDFEKISKLYTLIEQDAVPFESYADIFGSLSTTLFNPSAPILVDIPEYAFSSSVLDLAILFTVIVATWILLVKLDESMPLFAFFVACFVMVWFVFTISPATRYSSIDWIVTTQKDAMTHIYPPYQFYADLFLQYTGFDMRTTAMRSEL